MILEILVNDHHTIYNTYMYIRRKTILVHPKFQNSDRETKQENNQRNDKKNKQRVVRPMNLKGA